MAKVANLRIAVQTGGSNTIFAAWDFAKNTGSGGAPVNGDIVKILEGSTWYNGVGIDSWVFQYRWYIRELIGDRAVIDKSPDADYSIMSPIALDRLTKEGTTTSSANAQHLEHFTVKWEYDTGDGVWFVASESTTKHENVTYSYPSNATLVRVTVAPISKTYGEGKNKKKYWTEEEVTAEFVVGESPPSKPSAPTVSIDNQYMLKASVDNISDARTDSIQFELYNGNNRIDQSYFAVVTARSTYYRAVSPGGKYRVRCRAINWIGNFPVYSDWSPFTSELETAPDGVSNITIAVESESTVSLKWRGDATATSYVVEASTDERYFDSSSEVKSTTVTAESAFLTGLTKGKRWFFRVRAKNSHGESPWSTIVNTVIGTKPEPPTTWSLSTTASVGDNLILYWVHNTEDGSKMVGAEIEMTIGGNKISKYVAAEATKSDREKIHKFKIDNELYRTGGKIEWRIRTMGVTHEYSDWSILRVINVYTPPTVEVRIGDGNKPNLFKSHQTLTGDWLNASSYEIISDRYKGYTVARTSEANKGMTQKLQVKAGKRYLFSIYVKSDKDNDTALIFRANNGEPIVQGDNATLEAHQQWVLYSASVTATKDGFVYPRIERKDSSAKLYICGMDFREQSTGASGGDGSIRNYPIPIGITARPSTQKAITCHISVVAKNTHEVVDMLGNKKVVSAGSEIYSKVYVMVDNNLYHELTPAEITLVDKQSYYLKVSASMDSGLVAQSQQQIDVKWSSSDYMPDGFVKYDKDKLCAYIQPFCFDRDGLMSRDVTLSVYRINANGTLFLVGSGIRNDGSGTVVDPHPTLDYARYRIVSTDKTTGINEYSDLPPVWIKDPAIVLQWDENWKVFDKTLSRNYQNEQWKGSTIKLPYNIDISEKYNVDSVLTEYIGRSNPVSYYGTQKGVTATWNTDIPKEDKELIYHLRRLANYSGDVYVREPNGSGYYARINISMNIKHRELVVPVTIDVQKVESGEIW
nr:MAG TPA: FN3 [Caudoviricetes sp.]